jgi:hypothetical protein
LAFFGLGFGFGFGFGLGLGLGLGFRSGLGSPLWALRGGGRRRRADLAQRACAPDRFERLVDALDLGHGLGAVVAVRMPLRDQSPPGSFDVLFACVEGQAQFGISVVGDQSRSLVLCRPVQDGISSKRRRVRGW